VAQMLLIAKTVAAVLTGSLSVISSVVDSAVDLVSGALMWWSGRAMKRRNIYQYPQGEQHTPWHTDLSMGLSKNHFFSVGNRRTVIVHLRSSNLVVVFVVSYFTIHLLLTYITVEINNAFHGCIDNFFTKYTIHRTYNTPINK
jgi:hypothetical protein